MTMMQQPGLLQSNPTSSDKTLPKAGNTKPGLDHSAEVLMRSDEHEVLPAECVMCLSNVQIPTLNSLTFASRETSICRSSALDAGGFAVASTLNKGSKSLHRHLRQV